jgi:Beta-ketoacyl synthase, C-terminal domain
VIAAALGRAAVPPSGVTTAQLHGTGTSLGDPIEIGAAAAVLLRGERPPLVAASIKSWLGHAETAAGVLGLLHGLAGSTAGAVQGDTPCSASWTHTCHRARITESNTTHFVLFGVQNRTSGHTLSLFGGHA